MESILEGLTHNICEVYLDDIIIYSQTFEVHVQHIQQVLRRLREHGVKVKPSKCHLFKHEVKYLGKITSSEGYRPDPALKKKIPTTVGDVTKLLGMIGYYRRYIRDFSKRAKPLYDLLKLPDDPAADKGNDGSKKKIGKQRGSKRNYNSRKKVGKGKGGQVSSKQPITWSPKHQQVLEELLDLLVHPPIMAFPDFNLPYVLHTDASQDGLGAFLYQKQNGECERCCEERVFVKQRMAFPGHNSKGRTHDKDRG